MKRILLAVFALVMTAGAVGAITLITKPYTFTNNTKADANKVNSDFDTAYTGINNAIGAINTAAGTKSTLAGRLAVSLNDDGTFKNISGVTVGSQWTNPGLLQVYSSPNRFRIVAADHTDIYVTYRRLKAILAASTVYSSVLSSAYTGGNTVVTLADAVLTSPVTVIEHSMYEPVTTTSSAMSERMATGYVSSTANTANAIIRRNAFGNFSAGVMSGTATAARNSAGGNIPATDYENSNLIRRGMVDTAGNIVTGAGFAVTGVSSGVIDIVWTTAFSVRPACVASHGIEAYHIQVESATDKLRYRTFDASRNPIAAVVNFICIGG